MRPARAHAQDRVKIGGHHYPNRGACMLVINVPQWASFGYSIVAPLMTEATKAKVAS